MAEELDGVYTTLRLKVEESDFKKAQELMLKIADNKAVQQGFTNVEKGLGAISQTAEKQYKSLQGLNAITAKGFTELAAATDTLIGKIEELGKQSAKSAEETKKSIKQAVDEAKEQTDGLDSLITKGAGLVGGYFAVDALRGYLRQAMAVRSQFQSIEYSMNVLLKSEEKGKQMFEDIKKFAIDTPMNMQGLASTAQMMLGFGIDSGEIMKNLKAIGDIAMGDSHRFQMLSLAFSQMSAAGKLMGQDLLQMINAGFNPLQQISEETGKTIGELKEEMSKGLLTADRVKQAFWDAASEGGKYYGMMELQATTIKGQQEKLNDAMDAMYNEIAEKLEGTIINVIKFGGELVENWKEVARWLGALVTAYGAYRAAIMITTAVQKASVVAERALAAAHKQVTIQTKAATTAQVLFNQAQNGIRGIVNSVQALVNPWTLLAVGIGAATTALVLHLTKETELQKAQKKLNDIATEYNANVVKEQREVDKLFGKLKSLAKGSEEYKKQKAAINETYGKYLKYLDDEKRSLEDVEGAYKAVSKAIREKYKLQSLDKAYSDYVDKTGEGYKTFTSHFYERIDQLDMSGLDKEQLKGEFGKVSSAAFNELESEIAFYRTKRNKAKELKEKLDKQQNRSYKLTDEETRILSYLDKSDKELYEMAGNKVWADYFKNSKFRDLFTMKLSNTNANMGSATAAAASMSALAQNSTVVFDDLQLSFGKMASSYFVADKVWQDASLMFQRDNRILLGDDEGDGDKDKKPPKNTPITEDPNIKALNDLKKKSQEKRKIGNQILKEYGALKDTYDKLDEAFGMEDADRQDAKHKAGEETTYSISRILAEHPDFTDNDKKEIDAYYKEVGNYTYEQAKAALLKIGKRKAELEKEEKELTPEKLSKKKGADNSDEVAKNKKALERYKEIAPELEKVSAQYSVLQDIVNRGVDLNKFEEKSNAFQTFAENYARVIGDSRKELEQLQRELADADTPDARNLIRQKIEQLPAETDFQTQKLIDDFRAQYGEEMPREITDFLTSYMKEVADWTVTQINAELLGKNKELKSLQKEAKKTGKDLSKEIAKVTGEIKALESAKDINLQPKDSDAAKAWKKTKKAVSALTSAFNDLGKSVGGSTEKALNALSSTLNTSIALADSVVEFTKQCKDMIVATATEGVTALKVIEASSVILEIISLVVQLGQAIANAFNDDAMEQFRESVRNLREDIRDLLHELELEKRLSKSDTIFGSDYWGNFVENSKIMVDADKKWQEVQEEITKNALTMHITGKNPLNGKDIYEWTSDSKTFAFGDAVETMRGQFEDINNTIANMKVKWEHATWVKSENSESLKSALPELFDDSGNLIKDALSSLIGSEVYKHLSEENQEYISEMSKAWEEYKEYLQTVKDSFADFLGGIGNNIGDMFVNAFKTGESCLEDFEESWDLAMENILNSVMYNNFLQPIFENAQTELENIGYFENPEEHQDELMQILLKTKEETLKQQANYDDAMRKAQEIGLYESGKSRSSVSGGINSLTQDTAEGMNGRLTQIQSHTFSINEQMKSMHELSAAQLEILQGIKGDTARLSTIEENMVALKRTVTDMQTYGIKVK